MEAVHGMLWIFSGIAHLEKMSFAFLNCYYITLLNIKA